MYRLIINHTPVALWSASFSSLEAAVQGVINNESKGVHCSIAKKCDDGSWEQIPGHEYLGLLIRMRG